MGFSTLDGLVMATRSGSLDPGVVLYLMDHFGLDHKALEDLLYHQSGLLGVSSLYGDVRRLLASNDARSREAIDLFVYRINRELGSLAAALGGLDALVFTGGIGCGAAPIRAAVARLAHWLGVEIDPAANAAGGPRLSPAGSRVAVWCLPTDENLVIARQVLRVVPIEPLAPVVRPDLAAQPR
jgi:acetate kinase